MRPCTLRIASAEKIIKATSLDDLLVEHAPWCRTTPDALPTHIKPPMSDVVVFVEVPSGSRNKYELDPELGGIVLDRRPFTVMGYPPHYRLIESTIGGEGVTL